MYHREIVEKYVFLVVISFFTLLPYEAKATDDIAEIHKSFNIYKHALANKSGMQALSVVSQKTINYYQKLRDSAITDGEKQIRQLPISQKMSVLMYRMRLSPAELQRMDGKKLFIHSVNNGWISQNSVNNVELGQIAVEGNTASANVVSRGKKRNLQFEFHREAGAWKIDLTSMMNVMDKGLQALAKSKQMTEDQVAVFLVERATGKKVTQKIWDKP